MNEAIPAAYRDINVVTAEIKVIKQEAQAMALNYAVEIGRRLTEAKGLLQHGEWGTWLETEVEFSQRSATNFMRLFEEYGSTQNSLFGAELNQHARADLPLRKALQLLAIPSEEREEFIEKNDVENKSTRELEKLIRERDALLKEKADISVSLGKAEAEKEKLQKKLESIPDSSELNERIEKLTKESSAARQSLAEAEKKAAAAADELKRLKENPEIPAEELEKIRKDVMGDLEKIRKDAATAAGEEYQKKLSEAQAAGEEYQKKLTAAEAKANVARAEAEELRKQLAQSDAEVTVFRTYFTQIQEDFNKMDSSLAKIKLSSPETAEKLTTAIKALLDSFGRKI